MKIYISSKIYDNTNSPPFGIDFLDWGVNSSSFTPGGKSPEKEITITSQSNCSSKRNPGLHKLLSKNPIQAVWPADLTYSRDCLSLEPGVMQPGLYDPFPLLERTDSPCSIETAEEGAYYHHLFKGLLSIRKLSSKGQMKSKDIVSFEVRWCCPGLKTLKTWRSR